MAEINWSSLATNLIPAALGAIAGGGRGGMGAIPGALYGLGSGARMDIQSGMARDEANAKIAQQNIAAQQNQQRIDLEKEQIANQRQRWMREDKTAEQMMEFRELQMQEMQRKLDEASRSTEARETLRSGMKDDQERALFDADPKSWLERKDQEVRLQGAGTMLQQFGLQNGDELAKVLGPQGTAQLLGSIVASRNKPTQRFGFHYDSNTGMGFSYDKTSGQVQSKKIGEPRTSPERRSQVESALFRIWKGQNPNAALMAEESGDMSPFYSWRTSQEGTLQEQVINGEISPQEFRGYLGSLKQQEQQIQAEATEAMRQAYMGAGTNQTEQGFQKHLLSPEGKQTLDLWKEHVKQGGRAQAQPTVAAPPASKPAAKQATPAPSKKRPSLDEIFG